MMRYEGKVRGFGVRLVYDAGPMRFIAQLSREYMTRHGWPSCFCEKQGAASCKQPA